MEIDITLGRAMLFLSILAILGIVEWCFPRRHLLIPKWRRWTTNLSINLVAALCVYLLFPVTLVSVASYAQQEHFGLFAIIPLPAPALFAITIILLDLAIYAQHVASHKIPILWRVHRVHHCDRDIDVTTAVRFHPIEIILSFLFKIALVLTLGLPPIAVLAFEILLNSAAMFNHANITLPQRLDAILRCIIVTPDMHRVHHSVHTNETDANYGFSFSFWDRLFKTYIAQPIDGHRGMRIGLAEFSDWRPVQFIWTLLLPLRKP